MKKLLCLVAFVAIVCTNSYAIKLAGLELSPEIGFAGGSTKTQSTSAGVYGGFARLWVGANNFVIAPQVKYDSIRFKEALSNTQFGISLGYNIGLIIGDLTPYIGVNYSKFSRFYKDTMAYSGGLKLKFVLVPISLGILYTFQEPQFNNTADEKSKMHTIQGIVALHF